MRPRVVMVLAIAAIIIGGAVMVPAAYARFSGGDAATVGGSPSASAKAAPTVPPTVVEPPKPTLAPGPVTEKVDGFFSWALLDRDTGKISGSKNITATNSTESMIKVWIVSDFLRSAAAAGKTPTKTQLGLASTAIRDSNDNSAETLFNAGGRAPVISRMIKTCGLTETKAVSPSGSRTVWWSYTRISARDAVRLGECVKSGKAAGPKWTSWVLSEMTKVRGTTAAKDQHETTGGGRWGIIDGLPPEIVKATPVSIKNGWTPIYADGLWHLNCLAITDDWVLAVETRYPIKQGLNYGAKVCASVATQLVTPKVGAALQAPAPAAADAG
jgi:hypothetical protein